VGDRPPKVGFYFDPMCPWAYRASRWIRDVRDEAGVEVDWRFFSLEEINREQGKRHPWERDWSYGWSQMRIAALLRRIDPALVDRWYLATGEAFFERGEPTFTREGAAAVVASMGLEASLVDAAIEDPSTAADVRADHDDLVSSHGGHGVPTLVFEDGNAFYGPVVLTPPVGAAALRLWDLVLGWREFPDLYELRRPKTAGDMRTIGESFSTYLAARRWRTVANPAP
jgi:predicted DsbA family dithiol-disulfide isomerase